MQERFCQSSDMLSLQQQGDSSMRNSYMHQHALAERGKGAHLCRRSWRSSTCIRQA